MKTNPITIKLKTGRDKNGKNWYMAQTIAGDFESEPVFIGVIEYRYLQTLVDDNKAVESTFDLTEEN